MLSDSEREDLQALTMRRKTAQALALRARVVLAYADGTDDKTVAAKQRVTQQTVSKWRARFVIHRVDGLLDAPLPRLRYFSVSAANHRSTWLSHSLERFCVQVRKAAAGAS